MDNLRNLAAWRPTRLGDPPDNRTGTPYDTPDGAKHAAARRSLKHPPVVFDPDERLFVDHTIRDHAHHREWVLRALNVRTNHVHVVIASDAPPEAVMGQFKAWASRRLRERWRESRPVWSRHGSTRYLNTRASFMRAIEYVHNEQ